MCYSDHTVLDETHARYVEIAKKLYPPTEDDQRLGHDEFPSPYDYDPIIDHFGTVVVRVDDDAYLGDARILYADTGSGLGYLTFGWGSCSVCDALQDCSTYSDLAELIQQLDTSIKWCSRKEMLKFFKEHDWEGDFGWHKDEQKRFVKEVIEYLETTR